MMAMRRRRIMDMTSVEIRAARKKVEICLLKAADYTDGNRTTTINAGTHHTARPEMNDCLVMCVGADIVDNVGAVVVPGAPTKTIFVVPARTVQGMGGEITCPTTPTNLAQLIHPAMFVQKVDMNPDLVQFVYPAGANGQPAARNAVYLQIIAFSGDQAALQETMDIPVDIQMKIDPRYKLIALGDEESEILLLECAAQKGKISAHDAAKPHTALARLMTSTGAKETDFHKIMTLQSIIGQRRLIDLFARADVVETLDVLTSIGDFTTARLLTSICEAIRTIDDTFTHDGFQLESANQALAFVKLNFGSKPGQISSGIFVKSTDKSRGNNSIAEVLHNLNFFLDCIAIVFLPAFCEKVRVMIKAVNNTLRTNTGTEMTTIVDALLQSISNPTEAQAATLASFLVLCDTAFDVSANNPLVTRYKEGQLAERSLLQETAIANSAAEMADMRAQLITLSKRGPPPTGGNLSAKKSKPAQDRAAAPASRGAPNFREAKRVKMMAFMKELDDHLKTVPIDGYAQKNHVGTKPLCCWIAMGKPCQQHRNGACSQYCHDITPAMSPQYIEWAKKRPVLKKVKPTSST